MSRSLGYAGINPTSLFSFDFFIISMEDNNMADSSTYISTDLQTRVMRMKGWAAHNNIQVGSLLDLWAAILHGV